MPPTQGVLRRQLALAALSNAKKKKIRTGSPHPCFQYKCHKTQQRVLHKTRLCCYGYGCVSAAREAAGGAALGSRRGLVRTVPRAGRAGAGTRPRAGWRGREEAEERTAACARHEALYVTRAALSVIPGRREGSLLHV